MAKLATGPYDILVTDLGMPDMNGFDLTLKVKTELPDIKATRQPTAQPSFQDILFYGDRS